MKKDETPIPIRDSKDIKNIIIQINLKNNTTSILSAFSAWENLALIMEALGTTAQKCIQEGIDKKQVYRAINDYLGKALNSYTIISGKAGRKSNAWSS